jgi:hypothetical protein
MRLFSQVWKKLRLPSFTQVARVLFLLGFAGLCFVGGAAIMYFGLPPSSFLGRAFIDAETWLASLDPPAEPQIGSPVPGSAVTVDKPAETFDGYTLYTTTLASSATLIDMKGNVVHQWQMRFRRPWPKEGHVVEPLQDGPVHWERAFAYPNGDLLALCASRSSAYGYALAKFDKDSNLLWNYAGNPHHDLDVGDDGKIYVLTCKRDVPPPATIDTPMSPYVADYLVVLSPSGETLDTIPILEAIESSPHWVTFTSALEEIGQAGMPAMPKLPPDFPGPNGMPPGMPPGLLPRSAPNIDPGDIVHANSVRLLGSALASKFSAFKPGQILLSLRSTSLVAVLDPQKRSIVWAARGPWKFQHDAQFLDNGHLLLFDNLGSLRGSRVVEYDPVSQGVPWTYLGEKVDSFKTVYRGMNQRLANGNTLIIDAEGRKLIEVTRNKNVVWRWDCKAGNAADGAAPETANFTGARRYTETELPFLKEMRKVAPR